MSRFSKKETPAEMPFFEMTGALEISAVLKASGLVSSTSEARRLIAEGAVYLDDTRVADPSFPVDPAITVSGSVVVRIGRRRYLRLTSARSVIS